MHPPNEPLPTPNPHLTPHGAPQAIERLRARQLAAERLEALQQEEELLRKMGVEVPTRNGGRPQGSKRPAAAI